MRPYQLPQFFFQYFKHLTFDIPPFAELMTAVCMAVFYWNFTSICGISGYLFDCDVHGVPFKCIIPNHWKVPNEHVHGST